MQDRGFDAEHTARIAVAFEVAWNVLTTKDPRFKEESLVAREALAKLVINDALRGERSTLRLVEHVLARFCQGT